MRSIERPLGRILALDLGEVRTGVAISDSSGVIARPLQIFESKNLIESLRDVLHAEEISEVVVGVPKTLRGEIGGQARRTLKVLDALRTEFPEVHFVEWDERFTSRIAGSRKKRTGKARKPVDDLAAARMLQEYLESENRR